MANLTTLDLNPIELFAITYLPHWLKHTVPGFHRKWYADFYNSSVKKLAVEAMRGGAKSTVCKIACLYWICEGDQEQYHLISQSGGSTGLSSKWMADIRGELEENKLLIADYGIRRGKAWGIDHIQIIRGDKRKVDFYSRGKHCSIRGTRGNIIIDDPQDIGDCRSETVMSSDEDWFFSDVLPVLIDDQRLIFIGTPISPLSLLSKVKQLPGWKVSSFPIEDEHGHSVWPQQYPDEVLAEKRAEMGLDRYKAEYLCQPMISGNPVFKREWFKFYETDSHDFKENVLRQGLFTICSVDPAISLRESADFTAITVVSVLPGGTPRYYVRHVERGHWTMKETTERLFAVFDKFQQHKTLVETVAYQQAIMEEIRERERIYGKYINAYEIKPDKDKLRRAFSVQALFQQGQVFFDATDKEQRGLMDELIMFTGEGTYPDDRVDAIVYALDDGKGYNISVADYNKQVDFGVTAYGG
jgi:predicted phage terminase large subunit-like protein